MDISILTISVLVIKFSKYPIEILLPVYSKAIRSGSGSRLLLLATTNRKKLINQIRERLDGPNLPKITCATVQKLGKN